MKPLFLMMAVWIAGAAVAAAQSKSAIHWRKDSDDLYREAAESGKPILYEAWASWCGPCREMDREVWSDPQVIAETRKFVCISLDLSLNQPGIFGEIFFGTTQKERLTAVPTVVLMDPWEELIVFRPGLIGARELTAMLKQVPADYGPARKWHEMLVSDRSNASALMGMGDLYQTSGAFGVSNRYFREALKSEDSKRKENLRENLSFRIAMNEMRRNDWKSARRQLEQLKSDYPHSRSMDQVLLGLLLVDLHQDKVAAARQRLTILKQVYPGSDATAAAERLLNEQSPRRR